MQPTLNRVILVGIVGRDPEMRYTAAGDAVAAFPLSVPRTWVTGRGEHRESVDWFSIIAWHRQAEWCQQQLHKGMRAYVEGRLQARSWTDESGAPQHRAEIVATDVVALDAADVASTADAPLETDAPDADG